MVEIIHKSIVQANKADLRNVDFLRILLEFGWIFYFNRNPRLSVLSAQKIRVRTFSHAKTINSLILVKHQFGQLYYDEKNHYRFYALPALRLAACICAGQKIND